MTKHLVIARRERSERRGNPSCLERRGRVCLFGYSGPVDRHGLRPRDDKCGVDAWCLSLRGGSGARGAAIHRVSRDLDENAVRLLRSCGSPRASALAMTKLELGNDQRLVTLPLFNLHSSPFTLKVWSLGSFGPAGLPPCLGQDSPRSHALLAFLETYTEA